MEVIGRTGLLYIEGYKSMHIDSEFLVGPSGLLVFSSSIHAWDSPNNDEIIGNIKKETIVENIRRAFRFRNLEIEVQ